MTKKKQEWRDIPGYEGYFMVSNIGHVFNVKKEKLLKLSDMKGYRVVSVYNHIGRALQRVHRLVALAFIPNPENKPHVNHLNGIRWDNRPENLEWCTHLENVKHAHNFGLVNKVKGENALFVLNNDEMARSVYEQYDLNDKPVTYLPDENEPRVKELKKTKPVSPERAVYLSQQTRYLLKIVEIDKDLYSYSDTIDLLLKEELKRLLEDSPGTFDLIMHRYKNISLGLPINTGIED